MFTHYTLYIILYTIYSRWGDLSNFGFSALSAEDIIFPLIFLVWSVLVMLSSSRWGKWKAVLIGGILAPMAIFLIGVGFDYSSDAAQWAILGIVIGIIPGIIISYILAIIAQNKLTN